MISLYDLLRQLPTQSPRGVALPALDARGYAALGRAAIDRNDRQEAAYWYAWAARSYFAQQHQEAPAILANLATAIAQESPSFPERESARLLWGLAALSGDCTPLRNIAASLDDRNDAGANPARAQHWQSLSHACVAQQ
jgi:hypothetical protein